MQCRVESVLGLLGFLAPQPPSAKTSRIHSTKASGSAGPLLADPLFFCPQNYWPNSLNLTGLYAHRFSK
jgi:hypothetical protein